MLSPVIIGLLMVCAYFYTKQILTHKKVVYALAWLIVILVVLFQKLPILTPLVKGFVGFAFMYVVMIAGALNPKWTLTKRLKSIRTPYAVIGFTILIAHPLSYVADILNQSKEVPWYGLASFLIMIPLFITSYIYIRKRMKPATWKKLHKWAYLSYMLMLIHLIVNASSVQNRIAAILLFIPYIILKILKEFKNKQKRNNLTSK
jgi:methionine sulfoxide reductase heme-binding subunit